MTSALTVTGWLAAAIAATAAAWVWHRSSLRADAVASACHELRGPLTCVSLGLELAGRVGGLSSARIRALELELRRAALVIEDLGDVRARVTDLRALDRVDVGRLAAECVEAWSVPAEAQGAHLSLRWQAGAAPVWGDRLRLAQATGNLIANAIEHGGGAIEIIGRRGPGRVRIEVLDRGPGLPGPLTEVAHRAHRCRGRRGRGLAIASAIMEAHGGTLSAGPTSQGARVILALPAADGLSLPADREGHVRPRSSRFRA